MNLIGVKGQEACARKTLSNEEGGAAGNGMADGSGAKGDLVEAVTAARRDGESVERADNIDKTSAKTQFTAQRGETDNSGNKYKEKADNNTKKEDATTQSAYNDSKRADNGAENGNAHNGGKRSNLESAVEIEHKNAKNGGAAVQNTYGGGGIVNNCAARKGAENIIGQEKNVCGDTMVQSAYNDSKRANNGAKNGNAHNGGERSNLESAVEIEHKNAENGGAAVQNIYGGGGIVNNCVARKGAENIIGQEKNVYGDTLYLVTGAHGFIGREVCMQLCAQGKRVRALIRKKREDITLPPEAEICTGDLLDISSLERFFQNNCGEIIVIHCAAVISVKKKSKTCVSANVSGTQNIIDFCLKYKVKKLVYLGSVDGILAKKGEVVEEPREYFPNALKTDYAKSKAQSCAIVLAAQRQGFETAVVLPSAVIGPYDYKEGFITHILKIYTKGLLPRLSIKGGYDFVDVRDVAAAVISACGQGKKGSYIVSNEYLSMTQVFDAFALRLGRKPTAKTLPMGVLYPLAAVASFFNLFNKGEPILTFSALDIMKDSPVYSHKKATEELDFYPRPPIETLNDTADYLRETIEKEKEKRSIKNKTPKK